MSSEECDRILKPLTIKDLRVQCRARGITPAGSVDALRDRIKENMLQTRDLSLKAETGEDLATVQVVAGHTSADAAEGKLQNNFSRPGGQNVGNFITERPSSRVLAAPGGRSQIVFGDGSEGKDVHLSSNNYTRPNNQQNVGNFLTERNSSRVLAPPGGKSQITFG